MTCITSIIITGYCQAMKQAEAFLDDATLVRIDWNGDAAAAGTDTMFASGAITFGCPSRIGDATWRFQKFNDSDSGFTDAGSISHL